MDESGSNEVSITKITIKKEQLNDEIKEFAETAMNELLGWYGYENPREENRRSFKSRSRSSSGGESPKIPEACGWCSKPVEEHGGLISASAVFCSELCFSQSRRANFKKTKTCDWCRHVRNTVSYVDFQDGASQLQFCSDKCLNQYKMHIFCRETRAHLELHPHLHREESAGALITPELWMKNCKSPDLKTPTPPSSPKLDRPQTSPLPLVMPHPKPNLELNESKRCRVKIQKKNRKRCSSTATYNFPKNEAPQDLRVRPLSFERLEQLKEPVQNHHNPKHPFHPDPRLINPQYFNTNPPAFPPRLPVKRGLEGLLPPPTVLVPYPIILPLPIPIPIPIPIPNLLKKFADKSSQTEEEEDHIVSSQIEVLKLEEEDERHLRKRKRSPQTRPKIFVKNKRNCVN